MDVDGSVVADPPDTPNAVEQLEAAQGESSVLGEVVQKVELASGEGNRLTRQGHFAPPGIDHEVPAEVDRCWPACGGGGAAAATEDRLDASDKFTGENGLVT